MSIISNIWGGIKTAVQNPIGAIYQGASSTIGMLASPFQTVKAVATGNLTPEFLTEKAKEAQAAPISSSLGAILTTVGVGAAGKGAVAVYQNPSLVTGAVTKGVSSFISSLTTSPVKTIAYTGAGLFTAGALTTSDVGYQKISNLPQTIEKAGASAGTTIESLKNKDWDEMTTTERVLIMTAGIGVFGASAWAAYRLARWGIGKAFGSSDTPLTSTAPSSPTQYATTNTGETPIVNIYNQYAQPNEPKISNTTAGALTTTKKAKKKAKKKKVTKKKVKKKTIKRRKTKK